jgi:DNA-binding MarR family transcriptional regulator
MALSKRKPVKNPHSNEATATDAKRLAEIFPKMMTALSHITHAEELIHENLTPSQIKVLNILGDGDRPKRMSEIAKELGITQASLTETAKKLAGQGYINRARKADDDRVVNVTLTPQGEDLAVKIKKKIVSYFNFVCDGLEPEERERLVASHEFILKTYVDAVKNKADQRKAV